MKNFEVKMVAIENVFPYENNAKLHPKQQIESLAKEISEVGWSQPIVVDPSYVVIVGHGRLLAAKHLGLKKVPVKVMEGLSAERVRAMRLFDNKISETGWNMDLVKAEIVDLSQFEMFDMSWTGFNDVSIVEPHARKEPEGAVELNPEEFESFEHKCPKCGFEYNDK